MRYPPFNCFCFFLARYDVAFLLVTQRVHIQLPFFTLNSAEPLNGRSSLELASFKREGGSILKKRGYISLRRSSAKDFLPFPRPLFLYQLLTILKQELGSLWGYLL